MLIQFTNESTRAAYGATSDRSRLDMREGASRNSCFSVPSISVGQRGDRLSESSPADRHRAAKRGFHLTVQGEHPSHSYSSTRESDAAFRERIAFRVFGSILFLMFVLPLILAGIAVKFG